MDEQSDSAAQERTHDTVHDTVHDSARTAGQQSDPEVARDDEPSALLSRLRLIEDQPLQDRAEALAQLHDELRALLESGDSARPHA